MPDFLSLPRSDREEIINKGAVDLGWAPVVLEKDVWVCWALKCLFEMPDRVKMAFKGGTSLSKVFSVIHRFSEDIDVTLDYRTWGEGLEHVQALSRTKQKACAEKLREKVKDYTHGIVKPHFERELRACGEDECSIELNEEGEKLRIRYRPLHEDHTGYVAGGVVVEFGGRNITEPYAAHVVEPYLAQLGGAFTLPVTTVDVLSPLRTFWEKATLIHVACQERFKKSADRQSRHWYDVYMLCQQESGEQALEDMDLLRSVLMHKGVFYYTARSNYEACMTGGFRLVPSEEWGSALRADYNEMRSSGMFWSEPPGFDQILETLATVQDRINTRCRQEK